MWSTGDRIGPYTIIDKIGEGTFGTVWLAARQNSNPQERYALKIPKQVDMKAILKEAVVWAQASHHPNIVPIVEADVFSTKYGDQGVIVSLYMPEGSLAKWLGQNAGKAPSQESAIQMMNGILDGLEHLERVNIVHRDLKPDNILLRSGRPLLTDFGIARVLGSSLKSSVRAGTQLYMSPEAFEGYRSHKTDLWSASVIFYQMLSGHVPFATVAAIHKIEAEPLPPPIPPAIQEVVSRALNKNEAARFDSAAALRTALRSSYFRESQSHDDPNRIDQTLPYSVLLGDHGPQPKTGIPPASENDELSLLTDPDPKEGTDSIAGEKYPSTVIATQSTILKSPSPHRQKQKVRPFKFDLAELDANGAMTNRRTGQAWSFIEDLSEGLKLEMVEIPGGSFLMGSPITETRRTGFEGPQHNVGVPRFYIGKYLVTQAQWRAIAAFPRIDRDLKRSPSRFDGDLLPVEQISWEDGLEFCARLSSYSGKHYRFPSEAEWEYACRAGMITPFCFGEGISTQVVNHKNAAQLDEEFARATTIVGSLGIANKFGLYDTHGNVYEWCSDSWHENYRGAPTDGSSWSDEEHATYRVRRGGSWRDKGTTCRSAYRSGARSTLRNDATGFRIAASTERS